MTPETSPADQSVEGELEVEWDEVNHPNGPQQDYVVSEETKALIRSKREKMLELARNPPPHIDHYHKGD